MRRVTRLLLVASFAAVGLTGITACSDDVTVVEPPPTPPPPPPPPDDAEISIVGLRDFETGADLSEGAAVTGQVVVLVDIESGDFDPTSLELLVDGDVANTCQTFSAASVAESGSEGFAGVVVECLLNTAAIADDECVGQQASGEFQNGDHFIGARLNLDDGSSVTAERGFPVEFENTNSVFVEHLAGGQGIVGPSGETFWGGPADLDEDGEDDNILQFAVCPVVFQGDVTVGEVQLAASTDGPQAIQFETGDAPGGFAPDDEAPFVFSVLPEDNDGVEDMAPGDGHTIGGAGQVNILDDTGSDITGMFPEIGVIEMFNIDYTGPDFDVGGTTEIQIEGQPVPTGSGMYAAEGEVTATFIEDDGVGGADAVIDVNANASADHDFEAGDTVVEDIDTTTELPEDDAAAFAAEIVEALDLLSNASEPPAPIVTGDFGADQGAPEVTAVMPETTPDDDPLLILNDDQLQFDATDPDLSSGDPGSGIQNLDCDPGPCTGITADLSGDATGTRGVVDPGTDGDDLFVNLDFDGTGAADPLADGSYTVTVTVPDLAAVLGANGPNVTEEVFTFMLDRTGPEFTLNKPALPASSNAAALETDFEGKVTDVGNLTRVQVFIEEAGPDDSCLTRGDNVTTGIDPNDVEVDVETIAEDGGFVVENVTIDNPGGAAVDATYCFIVEADDNAVDRAGDPNPNTSESFASTDVTWNP